MPYPIPQKLLYFLQCLGRDGIYVASGLGRGDLTRVGKEKVLLAHKKIIMLYLFFQPAHKGAAAPDALIYGQGLIPVYAHDNVLMGDWRKLALVKGSVKEERRYSHGNEHSPCSLLVPQYPLESFLVHIINPVKREASLLPFPVSE